MQTLFKFIKRSIVPLFLIIARAIAQLIFGILYNPKAEDILGIPNTGRGTYIIESGYVQIQQESKTNSIPYPVHNDILSETNQQCIYGEGRCQIFVSQYLLAALKRLDTIQFVGKYVTTSVPNDITNRITTISRLSPYWTFPYIFGITIGPTTNKESHNKTEAQLSRTNAAKLGEVGIQYLCDSKKIKKIKDLTYKEFIQAAETKDPSVWSPCQDYRLPHAVAFNYFYYLKQPKDASFYYMVAALHDDVPSITVSMPAIVRGRAGDNLTSASIWYDKFQNNIAQYRKNLSTMNLDEKKESEKALDTSIKKAVSEISMYILTQTYPYGLTGNQTINTDDIKSTIKTIETHCIKHLIACDLISIGMQKGRIKTNGTLIYPIDNSMKYGRRSDEKVWWLIQK